MPREKFNLEKVKQAIESNGGFVSDIAKALKVSRVAVWKWRKKYSGVEQAFRDVEESHLDLCESKLIEAIKQSKPWAICFYLKCKGKSRGYVERAEHDVRSNVRVESDENDRKNVMDEILSTYTREQLHAIIDGLDVIKQPYEK